MRLFGANLRLPAYNPHILERRNAIRIYAGNLSSDVTEDELRNAFLAFGKVTFVKISQGQNGDSGTCFGLIGMPFTWEAKAAITGLRGKSLKGQTLEVDEAGARVH